MLSEESRYKLLKALEANPRITQRELSAELGISLGKVNYCIKALIEKGFVKAKRFTKNSRKLPYVYLLTPSGFEEKANVTIMFLKKKRQEYNSIKQEINRLVLEVGDSKKISDD